MTFRLPGTGIALSLWALALPAWGHAPELTQPTAQRLAAGATPPVIDGRLDDPAWLDAPA